MRGGFVYETYPLGGRAAVRRPAMGAFTHEAAACDPDRKVVYLTEDENHGCLYRFRPDRWGDLSAGTLEAMVGGGPGPVTWGRVPDPSGRTKEPRKQVAGAVIFNGGEGCWYDRGVCYFTTKGDGRVWAYVGSEAGRARCAAGRAAGTAVVAQQYLEEVRHAEPPDLPVRPLLRRDVGA